MVLKARCLLARPQTTPLYLGILPSPTSLASVIKTLEQVEREERTRQAF